MKLITTSVLTLLALYVLYSEPIKLPPIVKKNKKLCYILIIGSYLYYHQNNDVEGIKGFGTTRFPNFYDNPGHVFSIWLVGIISVILIEWVIFRLGLILLGPYNFLSKEGGGALIATVIYAAAATLGLLALLPVIYIDLYFWPSAVIGSVIAIVSMLKFAGENGI